PARTGAAANGPTGFVHETATYRDVWKNVQYRRVISAQFLSNTGTWMEMFAISMFVAHATMRLDDQGALGLVQQLPIAVLGLLGGLAADRLNRRALLVYTQALAGVVALGVAAVSMIQFDDPRTAVNWLFALGLLNGCVLAFNFPAWQVLTPRLVPREQLGRALALNGIQFNLARVLGPALAGFIIAQFAAIPGWEPYASAPCLLFNAASFFFVAWVVSKSPDAPPPAPDGHPVLTQLKAAWSFVIHKPGPRAVLIAQVLLSFLAAPLVRMLSLYVIDVYGIKEEAGKAQQAGGLLLAVQGVGAVIGGISLRWIPSWYPKHHFMPLSVALLGLSITVFSMTTALWTGYAAMLVCGFFWIWAFNQSWSAMQLLAPDHMRGRVLSLVTVLAFGATALGAVIAGVGGEQLKHVLSHAHATQLSVGGLSVVLMFAGMLMMVVRTPEVDGLDRRGHKTVDLDLANAVLARRFRPPPPSAGDVPPSASLP
ncbi:MAG TPA: MFS transporter, partial [Phycisphaerales bacterium]|nr:MFS transporter [Phycisphaerales bacterium]